MATVGGNRQEKRKRIMSYFINATIELMEKEELNEMSVLIYRGMLAIMRSDRDKPTVDEAVDKTVRYLAKTLDAYHLG